jgi:hypothetical protein
LYLNHFNIKESEEGNTREMTTGQRSKRDVTGMQEKGGKQIKE